MKRLRYVRVKLDRNTPVEFHRTKRPTTSSKTSSTWSGHPDDAAGTSFFPWDHEGPRQRRSRNHARTSDAFARTFSFVGSDQNGACILLALVSVSCIDPVAPSNRVPPSMHKELFGTRVNLTVIHMRRKRLLRNIRRVRVPHLLLRCP